MSLKIAIQGFEGCFHQVAAQHYFGRDMEILPCISFNEVTRSVSRQEADAGIMAIENSIAGSILPNYNLLQRSNLFVIGEIYLHISQHLMMIPGQTLKDIKEVHSHPMALLQCTDFLEKYPHWRLVETEDTALSAKMLRQHKSKHVAAIAGKLAAELYGLEIISPDIHTERKNYTRFLILSREENKQWKQKPNKSSLYFQTANTHGSLAKVLTCIADEGVNLSKLQSFPVPGGEWHYYFHADMEFKQIEQLNHVIETIIPITKKLRVLGVYHKGMTV
jgi:prephenate dehydratase